MDQVYFLPGMDEPRSEPRDEGRVPKHLKPEETYTVEQALLARVDFQTVDGPVVQVPATLLKRANTSYLGHTSELFPTPWPFEDRWVRNDPFFRRIPTQTVRNAVYTAAEREIITAEIYRLAEIENPGRCRERRRYIDGWCHLWRMPGSDACHRHTPKKKKLKIQKTLREEQDRIEAVKLLEDMKETRRR